MSLGTLETLNSLEPLHLNDMMVTGGLLHLANTEWLFGVMQDVEMQRFNQRSSRLIGAEDETSFYYGSAIYWFSNLLALF